MPETNNCQNGIDGSFNMFTERRTFYLQAIRYLVKGQAIKHFPNPALFFGTIVIRVLIFIIFIIILI